MRFVSIVPALLALAALPACNPDCETPLAPAVRGAPTSGHGQVPTNTLIWILADEAQCHDLGPESPAPVLLDLDRGTRPTLTEVGRLISSESVLVTYEPDEELPANTAFELTYDRFFGLNPDEFGQQLFVPVASRRTVAFTTGDGRDDEAPGTPVVESTLLFSDRHDPDPQDEAFFELQSGGAFQILGRSDGTHSLPAGLSGDAAAVSDRPDVRITEGLRPGDPLHVSVRTVDLAGNLSEWSETQELTMPLMGCGVLEDADGFHPALFLPLLFLRRRKLRIPPSLLPLLGLLLLPVGALAAGPVGPPVQAIEAVPMHVGPVLQTPEAVPDPAGPPAQPPPAEPKTGALALEPGSWQHGLDARLAVGEKAVVGITLGLAAAEGTALLGVPFRWHGSPGWAITLAPHLATGISTSLLLRGVRRSLPSIGSANQLVKHLRLAALGYGIAGAVTSGICLSVLAPFSAAMDTPNLVMSVMPMAFSLVGSALATRAVADQVEWYRRDRDVRLAILPTPFGIVGVF